MIAQVIGLEEEVIRKHGRTLSVFSVALILCLFAFPYLTNPSSLILPTRAHGDKHFWGDLGVVKIDEEVVAPRFTLKDLNGKEVKLKDYRGKIVFLNFWAT
jgi:hypothetical protein